MEFNPLIGISLNNTIIFVLILIAICYEAIKFIKNIISIPGSILGMIILFLLLQFKVIREEKIKDVADFLLGNMGIFFIPAGVSLIQSLGLIKENAILLLSCIILINIAVMIGCGKSVDFMIKLKEKKETKSKQEIA